LKKFVKSPNLNLRHKHSLLLLPRACSNAWLQTKLQHRQLKLKPAELIHHPQDLKKLSNSLHKHKQQDLLM
jgi:hypothetical protein